MIKYQGFRVAEMGIFFPILHWWFMLGGSTLDHTQAQAQFCSANLNENPGKSNTGHVTGIIPWLIDLSPVEMSIIDC